MAALSRFASPRTGRSLYELAITAVPYLLLWSALIWSVGNGFWWGLVLVVPAAAFLGRLFLIQHDCGHGSFFKSARANDTLGRLLGVLTLIPYDYWRKTHAIHHATTGNLDRRGIGDVDVLTVDEYRALSRRRQRLYRFARHPAVLLGLGPLYLFVLKYRLPVGLMKDGARYWVSAIGTSLAIAALFTGVGFLVGFQTLLIVQVPVSLLAGAFGVWMFYVQHQFENPYWSRDEDWSFHAGALQGSTYYVLPRPVAWMTANIGIHHVHHLAHRIPFYRLDEAVEAHPELGTMCRLSVMDSLRCWRLALIDERAGRMVSFRDLGPHTA